MREPRSLRLTTIANLTGQLPTRPCEQHFAKTIFRSCEQFYTDADSRSAQIYKYRAFQVPRLKSVRGP
jgi:hypothetical protein